MSPIALPTEPQARTMTPFGARVFLGGQPKVGKTTLASQWNPAHTLFIDCEGGTRLLDGEHFVQEIVRYHDFVQTVEAIVAGDHAYKTFIIDTVDQLAKLADRHVSDGRNILAAGLAEYGKGLAEMEGLIRRDVGKLLATGHGVWFLGHTELLEVDKTQRMVPTVDKRVRGYILGACDFVFQAETIGTRRVLHTAPSQRFEAGSRVPMPEPLEMDPRQLFKAMKAGLDPKPVKPEPKTETAEVPA
jgi:hypothetical protein